MKKFVINLVSVGVLGMLLTGCGSNNTKKLPQDSKPISSTVSSTSPTKTTEELFQTTLTLPNGEIVKPNQTVKWKDLSIQLLVTTLPTQSGSPDKYKEIIGNHSTTINYEKVSTLAGKADFVLNKRTSPAASQSTTATYEYWVIVYGNQYAYAIDATIVGNKEKAKIEVLELVKNWNVPNKRGNMGTVLTFHFRNKISAMSPFPRLLVYQITIYYGKRLKIYKLLD